MHNRTVGTRAVQRVRAARSGDDGALHASSPPAPQMNTTTATSSFIIATSRVSKFCQFRLFFPGTSPVQTMPPVPAALRGLLDSFPRRAYIRHTTPIDFLPRLSQEHGGLEIFVKRDDLLPLAGGGSKTRKLEYVVADALARGADTLVTCGAVQSNHCRLTASAAALEGLGCHLVLEQRVPGSYVPTAGGNNYAFQLLGATVSVVDQGGVPAAADAVVEELKGTGRTPYWIVGGASNPLGALGYARCALEVLDSHEAFDAIIVASGSGGTHAGILAGLRAAGDRTAVHGISVRFDAATQTQRIFDLYRATAAHLGVAASPEDVLVHDDFVGPGYSRPTPEMEEAVKLFARKEGVLLDPVYTGKAAAGMLGLIRRGVLKGRVLFIHTGGSPALFHYQPGAALSS